MDIEMPGLDGLSAARQIVRDPGTPVIILTAHGHPNLIDQAVEDGVLYYLLKPVTSPSLHAALQVAVARAREIRTLRENVNTLEATPKERKLIEKAKGILMARRNLPEAEAFRLLQRQSQDRRMPMAKLAESIVQADELLESPPPHRLDERPATGFRSSTGSQARPAMRDRPRRCSRGQRHNASTDASSPRPLKSYEKISE